MCLPELVRHRRGAGHHSSRTNLGPARKKTVDLPLRVDDALGEDGANRLDRRSEQRRLVRIGKDDTEVIRCEGARQTRSEVITKDALVMSDVVIARIGELRSPLVV